MRTGGGASPDVFPGRQTLLLRHCSKDFSGGVGGTHLTHLVWLRHYYMTYVTEKTLNSSSVLGLRLSSSLLFDRVLYRILDYSSMTYCHIMQHVKEIDALPKPGC